VWLDKDIARRIANVMPRQTAVTACIWPPRFFEISGKLKNLDLKKKERFWLWEIT